MVRRFVFLTQFSMDNDDDDAVSGGAGTGIPSRLEMRRETCSQSAVTRSSFSSQLSCRVGRGLGQVLRLKLFVGGTTSVTIMLPRTRPGTGRWTRNPRTKNSKQQNSKQQTTSINKQQTTNINNNKDNNSNRSRRGTAYYVNRTLYNPSYSQVVPFQVVLLIDPPLLKRISKTSSDSALAP